jgi:hypothetical protein
VVVEQIVGVNYVARLLGVGRSAADRGAAGHHGQTDKRGAQHHLVHRSSLLIATHKHLARVQLARVVDRCVTEATRAATARANAAGVGKVDFGELPGVGRGVFFPFANVHKNNLGLCRPGG